MANVLHETARKLVAPGRGILAADESFPTIAKRFDSIGVESTEDARRTYREMLMTAPGSEAFVSGVIMFDETLRQSTAAGVPFSKVLRELGVVPGIKVDKGAKPMAGTDGEKVTEGLDGLRDRLNEYRELGAGFAKWRAVIKIANGLPTHACLHANAHALARYASLCQEAGIVPIVEPEVLMDGDHTLERSFEVTSRALRLVFGELAALNVDLRGILLKPNMVIAGKSAAQASSVDEVAQWTLRCLQDNVPAAVPGIVFLSGGQTPEQATAHLGAMNRLDGARPWALSFSYGRALQEPALNTWGGKADQVEAGAQAFLKRARLNSLAAKGEYEASLEG